MVDGVKILKANEVHRMTDICKEFTISLYDDEPDSNYLCALWSNLINQNTAIILYLEDNKMITGILIGIKSPHTYKPTVMAMESMLYVKPEAKGHGVKLIRAFEEWAYYNQCSMIKLSVATRTLTSERDINLYNRLGYNKIEEHFIKEV